MFLFVYFYEEFNVEKILEERTKHRRKEYLVKWEGYSDSENTWEPYKNVKMSSVFQNYLDKEDAEVITYVLRCERGNYTYI